MRLYLERRHFALQRLSKSRSFNVTPNKIRDLQQSFDEAGLRAAQAMLRFGAKLRHREQMLHTRLIKSAPGRIVARKGDRLAHTRQVLLSAMKGRLQHARSRLHLSMEKINALSPLAILQRGYAICRDESGVVLRDAAAVRPGNMVEVTLAQGGLHCRVEQPAAKPSTVRNRRALESQKSETLSLPFD